jgi:hypothetical protein
VKICEILCLRYCGSIFLVAALPRHELPDLHGRMSFDRIYRINRVFIIQDKNSIDFEKNLK